MKNTKLYFIAEKGANFKETIGAIIFALNKLYLEDSFVRCTISIDTDLPDFRLFDDRGRAGHEAKTRGNRFKRGASLQGEQGEHGSDLHGVQQEQDS